ncbi:TetR/AcrR family transcriptional regulator [Rhizobium sp. CFBP 8762]|uniref:TetR/AcrR family transcriptional regulator n=1 Tax=Rhizobium sp. CFBP 8762 TaxID=2775279 RepID=UPI00177C2E5A|nr:TetR/AcrR family transcriptional regulator [Rhizobium sp. CFBP 8762]MBD8556374.1 TetR/AcrR family transcriptional regulator [Rhizobium sp. CFBP 8762]
MRTVDPKKFAAQKQAILEAARQCFSENGFHKTTTELIGTYAKTSAGKLFHYFPNKKAIILAVIEDQADRTALLMETLEQQENAVDALREFFDVILYLAGSPSERQLILEIAAEAARDPDARAFSVKEDTVLTDGLFTLLNKATVQERLKPVVSNDHIVRFLMILIDGIFSRAATDADFDPVAERSALQTILLSVLQPDARNRHA